MEGMLMRRFVSISCLLLLCSSWAATAHAQQTTEVAVPPVPGSGLVINTGPTGTTGPLVTTDPAITTGSPVVVEKSAPKVDFRVDLTGTPVPETDEMAARRALRQYDESMRNWSLPPQTLNEILAESRSADAQDKFRLDRRDAEISGPRTGKELEWSRQRFADRVADSIYPGFGRIETTHANGATSRLDYIYTKRCGGKGGLGVCWQYRF